MFNVGTILTLTLATAVSYLVLFAGTLLAAALLIDTSVLKQTLQRPVDFTDYLTLACELPPVEKGSSIRGRSVPRPPGGPLSARRVAARRAGHRRRVPSATQPPATSR